MQNPFSGPAFEMAAMTAAINKLPNLYGRLAEMNLMPDQGIRTTSVIVEQRNGSLHIVRSRPRGAAADKMTADKRAVRSFVIPHIPVEDVLLPEDFQNLRAFGSENEMESQASVLLQKLKKMRNALDQTREFLRMGALKGIILDADGSTLYNLYTEFGITAATNPGDVNKYLVIDFALDDPETDVRAKCLQVKRHIEANLQGEMMTGVRMLVDDQFFDALTSHPEVKEAYHAYQALNQNLAEDYRRGFRFGGIVFEEYLATWTDKDGVARQGIADATGHAFPEGTGDSFETVNAPGNFLETANTVGLPYYAKQETRKFNAGLDLWAESNSLAICKRPEVLVRATA